MFGPTSPSLPEEERRERSEAKEWWRAGRTQVEGEGEGHSCRRLYGKLMAERVQGVESALQKPKVTGSHAKKARGRKQRNIRKTTNSSRKTDRA